MNRTTFSKAVVPGLFSFMTSSYKEVPNFYDQVSTVRSSKRTYEESAYFTGLGLFREKPERSGMNARHSLPSSPPPKKEPSPSG